MGKNKEYKSIKNIDYRVIQYLKAIRRNLSEQLLYERDEEIIGLLFDRLVFITQLILERKAELQFIKINYGNMQTMTKIRWFMITTFGED